MKPFPHLLRRTLAMLCASSMTLVMIGCDTPAADTTDTAQTTAGTALQTEAATEAVTLSPEEQAALAMYGNPDWAKDNWIIDIDPDWPHLYVDPASPATAEATMDDYFSYIFNTGVTDIILCPFEQSSLVPTASDAITWRYDKVNWTEEGGYPVNYDQFDLFGNGYTFNKYYDLFTKENTDIYAMAYEKVREAGIRPWLSFRMNDRHEETANTSYLRSAFHYEAKENGYMLGEDYKDYEYSICLDYSEERVRQVMLGYLREMILRYDVFGVQLDFSRNIACFDYLNDTDYAKYMTQFVRDIAAAVAEAEAKFGHDIKLMLRLGRSIEHNLVYGFDVKAFENENLVDGYVLSPEYSTDDGIPVKEWREIVGEETALFCGFEYQISRVHTTEVQTTRDYVKGYAAGYLDQGANGNYFNNFFQLGSQGPSIWSLTREDLTTGTRRYKVNYQDLVPIGHTGYDPLPMPLSADGTSITVNMGTIRPQETLTMLVMLEKEAIEAAEAGGLQSLPDVTVNGVAAASVRLGDQKGGDSFFDGATAPNLARAKKTQIVVYTFEGIDTTGELKVDFAVAHDGLGNINHMEFMVQ